MLVLLAMVQIMLGAGLVVGWAGIAGSVLTAPRAKGGAGLLLDQTTQLYGVAAACNYLSPLVLGAVLDSRGPRAASCLSNALVALGCFLFARATTFVNFALGIGLVAFGGPGVQTSVIHTANLFPANRYFVMGLVGECITLSFAIFPLMDVLWSAYDLEFEALFYSLAIVIFLSMLTSLFVWPDAPYQQVEHETEEEPSGQESADLVPKSKTDDIPLQKQSFFNQLTSGFYIRLSVFFLVTSFYANLYIATITTEV